MKKIKAALAAIGRALTSKEARPAELALARIVLAALGVKLGINFAEWVK